jgi:photosystem II stability/assembly factor-like uncharacterized protein
VSLGLVGCGDADTPLHLADLSAPDDMAVAGDLATPPDLQRPRWVRQTVPVPTSLYAIGGVAGEIYVVGDQGVVLRSTDDGAHWVLQRTDTTAALFGVWTDGTIAVAVGYHGALLRSIDHGATWVPTSSGSATLFGVGGGGNGALDDGGGATRLWAVGEAATVLESDDGGQTWAASSTTFPSGNLLGVWYSPIESFVVGDSGLYRTRDQGLDWTQLSSADGSGAQVWATGSGQILVAHAGSIVRSRDGGLTWGAIPAPSGGVAGFAPFASGEVWAASRSGKIEHNVGDFEIEVKADAADLARPIAAIWGRDPSDLFVVGDNGFIAHLQ